MSKKKQSENFQHENVKVHESIESENLNDTTTKEQIDYLENLLIAILPVIMHVPINFKLELREVARKAQEAINNKVTLLNEEEEEEA